MSEASARAVEADPVDRTLDESGTVLGERYRLLRPLGEGGAGIVYAASDERIGAEVAVKVVRGSARRDEVTLARFHREARATGKLGHPNIVRVTDFGTSPSGSPYVVMERLDGETLEARIAREGKLEPALAIEIHVQLADALVAAHAAGVLHRDVKPANVFLTQLATGKVLVKLLDFGLAELYSEPANVRLTERGLLVGSLAYLAPERLLGEGATERTDVYSVGASLYESLTGALPFAAPNPMMMRARILEGTLTGLDGIDSALTQVVLACLARDPTERIATTADVRRRLLVVPSQPSRPPAPVTRGPTPTPDRKPWIALALVALIALAAVYFTRSTTVAPVVIAPTSVVSPPPAVAPPPTHIIDIAPTIVAPPTTVIAPPPSSTPPTTVARTRPRRPATTTVSEAPPTDEPAPSRFDHIQEPDWGAPLAPR
jgi:serine/threonine-protein kinase